VNYIGRCFGSWAILACGFLLGTSLSSEAQENPGLPALQSLKTVAESSGFKATALATDVESFLKSLAAADKSVRLETIGQSVEGREIWSLQWNADKANPEDRLVVLLLGSIHPGESDGKEALLALARDLLSKPNALWKENLSLIFVPNYNVDGGERIGKNHRPGQKGPDDGMGIRENAQGLDLNRDFVKLESPEANALIRCLDQWDVDVLIDCHTTNGSLHQYELTYSTPNNPAGATKLQDYLRGTMMPAVTSGMKTSGYNSFWYGNFEDDHKRWESYGHEPRYSTEYMGMRGKIGILSESYSYSEYKTRIDATYAFVAHCLDQLAQNREVVNGLIAEGQSEWQASENDRVAKPKKEKLALQAKLARWDEPVTALGFELLDETGKPVAGANELAFFHKGENLNRLNKKEYSVELWTKIEPVTDTEIPVAYALSSEQAWVVDRLMRHGVKVWKFEKESQVSVANHKIKKLTEDANFQDHRLWKIEVETLPAEIVTIAAGSYLIPTAQPLGRLVTYTLEPNSDDSLAKWNFFDPEIRESVTYPVQRITQSLVADSLSAQPIEQVSGGEQLTMDKIFAGDKRVTWAAANAASPRWLPKNTDNNIVEYVMRRGEAGLMAYDAATGSSRRLDLIDKAVAALQKIEGVNLQGSRSAVSLDSFDTALRWAMLNIRRDLYIYDAEKDVARRVTNTPDKAEQLAELSPDGKSIAFVEDNNLMVVNTETAEVRPVTTGNQEDLLNGILDWVYQEEIYGRGNFKAFWWSPDAKSIAFLQLNEKPVDRYPVDDSLSYKSTVEETRYPKAGDPLPDVKLFIVQIADMKIVEADLSSYPADDRLVVRVGWRPDSSGVIFQMQNRIQTWLDICEANPADGNVKKLMREASPAWVDVIIEPKWLADGDFLWMSDKAGGRRHVYRVSADGQISVALTEGDWDVSDILWYDENGESLIVQGNFGNPIESHAFRVEANTKKLTRLTSETGSHRCDVDPTGRFFTDRHSNIYAPSRLDLKSSDGQLVRTLSATTIDRYKFMAIQPPILTTVKARDGMALQAMVILPPGVDMKNPDKKYPVFFHVYGGPQNSTISNRFQEGNYWWHQYLAQQGYVVMLCDNRASRGPGGRDTWPIHRNLGEVELRDLEDAAKWAGEQPWGDANRIGVWGWSYGGYFTAYALTHSKLFKAGISGAPVTDWRNYDAVYTERYMDTPQNNPTGYKKSSVVEAAKDLQGDLLIIHGEIDDNVHMSNTLQLAYALQKVGKPFEMMIYPRNRHGIVDPQQRRHMHEMMTEFLERKLKQ
jgi:dipeptidyl-peptidase 4